MPIMHKNLRLCRKRSRLTQADIAFIVQISDCSHISRWERGERTTDADLEIVYEMLFNIPSTSLFEKDIPELSESLKSRIQLLIDQLELQEPSQKILARLEFLKSVLTRNNQ